MFSMPIMLDNRSTWKSIMVLPLTRLVNGLGIEPPNLSPIPAAKIIAFICFPQAYSCRDKAFGYLYF
jgi:hypothetical protein